MNYYNNENIQRISTTNKHTTETNLKYVNSFYLKMNMGDSVIQINYYTCIANNAPIQSLNNIPKTCHHHFY